MSHSMHRSLACSSSTHPAYSSYDSLHSGSGAVGPGVGRDVGVGVGAGVCAAVGSCVACS